MHSPSLRPLALLAFVATFAAACDGQPSSTTARAVVRQALDAGMNTPPVATDDAASVDEDSMVTIDVLANDSDPDGDTLQAYLLMPTVDGTLTDNMDGTFTYVPRPNFNGSDTFTYGLLDGHGGSAQATVTITVNPVNDPPTFVAPTPPDGAQISGVVGQDVQFPLQATDVDDDPLTYGIGAFPVNSDPPVITDGVFHWTPAPGDSGQHSVTIWVDDGTDRDQRTVTLVIAEGGSGMCGSTECTGTDVCFNGACYPGCQSTSDCEAAHYCFGGHCARTACDGVSCPTGSTCVGGTCFPDCTADADCDSGNKCWAGRCATAACDGITCAVEDVCYSGACRPACKTTDDCASGKCFAGGCAADPCDGVACGSGEACTNGTCAACSGSACTNGSTSGGSNNGSGPRFQSSGCGCRAVHSHTRLPLLLLFGLALALRRRRRS